MRENGTAVWQGFDLTWLRTPHRLNHVGSWLDGLEHDERDGSRGRAVSRLTVGRVPDRGVMRTFVAGLRAPDVRFVDGEVEVEVGAEVGEAALVDGPRVEIPLDGASPSASTVLLRGFDLVCTSHPAGVHPQGLGVRLKDLRAEGDHLAFVPELYLHANNSPDPLTTWRGGFAYRARVHFTAVLGARDAAAVTLSANDRACVEVAHGRSPPGLVPRVVQGAEGFESGVLGLRGFRFDQRHRGRWQRDGRYVRRFHAFVDAPSYDPRLGRLTWHPRCWFSNAGMVCYPVLGAHQLWTTLLQVRGGAPVPRRVIEHAYGTGLGEGALEAPFALPLEDLALAG